MCVPSSNISAHQPLPSLHAFCLGPVLGLSMIGVLWRTYTEGKRRFCFDADYVERKVHVLKL